jgi:O-antigen/teichoic acid export membrane protein
VASESSGNLRSGFATVTAGTLFLIVATVVLVGFNFLARVLVVRSVSLASWDAFSLGFTLTQVLLAIGGLGLPLAVARSLPYAAGVEERREVIRTALWLGSSAAAVAGLALFLSASTLGHSLGSAQLGTGLVYFSVAATCLIAGTLLAAIFQGFSNVAPNALFLQVVSPGLYLGFLGLGLVLPPGHVTYSGALAAYAASAVVTLGALVVYTARKLPREELHGRRDRRGRGRLLHIAVPLFVTGVMASVAGNGDTLVLGAFHYVDVGTYTASLTFARLVQVGIAATAYIFLPVASGFLARGDRRAVRLTYVTVTKWLTVVSLPLFVVFVFLPSSSLDLVYGPNYAAIVLPLQVVVAGAFVGTLLGPAAMAQVASGQARLVAVNSVVAGAVDIAVALALVPPYGAAGAAAAWAVANVLYSALCLGQLAYVEGYHPFRRDFVVPLAVTGVPGCALLVAFHPHLPLLALPLVVVGFAVGFALVVLVTGSVDEGDRLLLEAVERLLGRPLPFVRKWAALARRRPRQA